MNLVTNLDLLRDNHQKNLNRWLILRQAIESGDPEILQSHKAICATDPIHFINTCITSYNPRIKPSLHPLILFPKQQGFILWLQHLEQTQQWGCLLKSRYTGASVNCCGYAIWRFIFDSDFKCGFGSNLERNVHTIGNIDSLLGKIEDMLVRLPRHLKPRYTVKKNLIRNLDNGSTITGDSGRNIGRGGRSTLYILDEAAHIEYDFSAIASLSENTDCCLLLSTPKGIGNQFANAWHSEDFAKYQIHWRDDPRRSQEWYEIQKKRFDPHIVAQELDCSFTGSTANRIIQYEWILSAQQPLSIPHIDLIRRITAGYDPAGAGVRDKHVLILRSGVRVIKIFDWQNISAIESANRVIDICNEYQIEQLNFDAGGGYGETLSSLLTLNKPNFTWQAINFGAAPTDYCWEDGFSSKDKFLNLRIEMYWALRERFRKAYEMHTFSIEYSEEELISIPNHSELSLQLTQPEIEFAAGRKMKLMSKADMAAKGIKSPDFADALALCFFEFNTGVWWRS